MVSRSVHCQPTRRAGSRIFPLTFPINNMKSKDIYKPVDSKAIEKATEIAFRKFLEQSNLCDRLRHNSLLSACWVLRLADDVSAAQAKVIAMQAGLDELRAGDVIKVARSPGGVWANFMLGSMTFDAALKAIAIHAAHNPS